jgi:hypothetical protein
MSTSNTRPSSSKARSAPASLARSRFTRACTDAVTRLNDVRNDNQTYNNRVDAALSDVFSLLSLFFLTIGRTREGPATYSQIASMRVSRRPSRAPAGAHGGGRARGSPAPPDRPRRARAARTDADGARSKSSTT